MLVYLPYIAVCSCHVSGCPVHKIVCAGSKNPRTQGRTTGVKKASGCILKIRECTLLSKTFPLILVFFNEGTHDSTHVRSIEQSKKTGC